MLQLKDDVCDIYLNITVGQKNKHIKYRYDYCNICLLKFDGIKLIL